MVLSDCRAVLEDGVLTLQTGRIRREYAWNEGHLVSQEIVDLARGHTWALHGDAPDLEVPGLDQEPTDGDLTVTPRPAMAFKPAHLQVDVTTSLGPLQVRRSFRLYPNCPAIACDLYLRTSPESLKNIPSGSPDNAPRGSPDPRSPGAPSTELDRLNEATLERLCIPLPHLALDCVQFCDVTDRRNTLVARRSLLPYRHESRLAGNLLFLRDVLGNRSLFCLKEAPCSDVQLAWPGYDIGCQIGEIRVVGIGVQAGDLDEGAWTRCYGFVTGVAGGDEYSQLCALRSYQDQVRVHKPGRDSMILLNTWGDRGQDTKISEAFALAELERAARLGVTHFQLDDGWQGERALLGAPSRALSKRPGTGCGAQQSVRHRAVPVV